MLLFLAAAAAANSNIGKRLPKDASSFDNVKGCLAYQPVYAMMM